MTNIKFDKEGNIKPQAISYSVKRTAIDTDIIRDLIKEVKKIEKRSFWCLKHNTFHNYIWHNKPSATYQQCLKNPKSFYKFKVLMSNYEIFNLKFKKNWNPEKANYPRGN